MIAALWLLLFSPGQVNPHLKDGLVALNRGELAKAQSELEQAETEEPRNPYVWTSLAQTYLREQQLDKADSAAAKAEETGGREPVIRHALGIFYFDFGQVLLRKQEFTHAANMLADALERDSTNAQLVLALGVARYGQRRFDDAITSFLKVIELDPQIEQPYLYLGKMLDQAGAHLATIVKDDRAWLAASPQNAKAQLVLAKALLAGDSRNEEALGLLERSIALDPTDWEPHYELGVLLANRNDYLKAAAELTRSIELDARQAMPHYHLARVYDRLGEAERAKGEREIHAQLTGTAPH